MAGKDAVMLDMAMRTGKSRVIIEHLERICARRVLIVCPSSVVNVWPEQFRLYSAKASRILPLSASRYRRVEDRMKQASAFMSLINHHEMFVVVINYEAIWRKPFAEWAMKQQWDALICDEIHRAKAPGGQASRYLARLAKKIPFRAGLTGTPFHHQIFDVYAQYRILDRTIYSYDSGKHSSYNWVKQRYGNWVPGVAFPLLNKKDPYKNQDDFMSRFRRIAFTVDASVLNLPEPTHVPIYFDLSAKGQRVYDSLEEDFYAKIDEGEITASTVLVKGLRLQQSTSGYGRIDGVDVDIDSEKAGVLKDMLYDFDEPVVIFCRFRHDLTVIQDVVNAVCWQKGQWIYKLAGGINELAEWQQDEKPSIIAVQIQAGGVGIDLSRARIAIYFSLGLSLGDYEQSLSRLQAKGQDHTIGYYYLLASNTIDGKIYQALKDRKNMIEELMRR